MAATILPSTGREVQRKYLELLHSLNQTEPCYTEDSEIWTGNWVNSTDAETAQAMCADCHVLERCREYAILGQEPEGIWGGTRPVDRLAKGKRGQRSGKNTYPRLTERTKRKGSAT